MTGYTKGNKPVQGGPQYKNKIETIYQQCKTNSKLQHNTYEDTQSLQHYNM